MTDNTTACSICGKQGVPDWDGEGRCISCARDIVLGTTAPGGDHIDKIFMQLLSYTNATITDKHGFNLSKQALNAYILAEVLSLIDYEYEMTLTDLKKREYQEGVEVPVLSKTDLRQAAIARFGKGGNENS